MRYKEEPIEKWNGGVITFERHNMILRVISYDKHQNTFLCIKLNDVEPLHVNLTAASHREVIPAPEKFIGRFVEVDTLEPMIYLGTNTRFVEARQVGMLNND